MNTNRLQDPFQFAKAETAEMRSRLQEAEAIVRLARLGFADEAQTAAMEYLRKYPTQKPA